MPPAAQGGKIALQIFELYVPCPPLSCRLRVRTKSSESDENSEGLRPNGRAERQARLMSQGFAQPGSEALPVLPIQPPAARLPREADRERAVSPNGVHAPYIA